MVKAGVGLGANVGDRAGAIVAAANRLAALPDCQILAVSRVYRSPPWGFPDQPDFLNACALVETRLDAHALLAACKAIEAEMGRRDRARWGPREIDIDILTYGGQRIETPELLIPHRELLNRTFALVPLAEIAPEDLTDGRRLSDWAADLDRRPGDLRVDDAASAALLRVITT